MSSTVAREVLSALSEFSSHTRLYELTFKDQRKDPGLLVEAFAADEQLLGIGSIDVIALSTRSKIAHASLLGQEACLQISLADGTRARYSGYLSKIATLGSDGGLSRYRLRLSPWIWLLSQTRNSRAWQDKTVIEIIDSVFAQYQPHAQWVWSGDVNFFMRDAVARSYCCQYRESDLDFVTRLLTEEGLGWRFEEHEDGSRMVLFSDTSQLSAAPHDQSSEAGGGIRYHSASSVEKSDSIQYLQAFRKLGVAVVTVLSYDYKTKQTISVSVPTKYPIGGKHAQAVESFDSPGQYAYADARQARRYAGLKMEAYEARGFVWQGRSTVRTLRPGTRICITDIPMKKYRDEAPDFVLLRVASVGVNNLPVTARNGLTELFGPLPELLEESTKGIPLAEFQRAIEQAQRSGYANCFEAIPAERPWRPKMEVKAGLTANGSQTAIVVGPDGSDEPNGADELYCDRLGRVRIHFHWQESDAGCWVRVGQRSAGSQFLPRIGQEVLVKFIEGDIDRPVIVGALYNGRGEGGVPPTPGGVTDRESNTAAFARAHDYMPSGQVNEAGGNSPVWHGAGSAGHRNNSAQWGVRSKEFGGRGYNQLLFDDTDGQGRVQLKTTHAATELNLGHLIHTADNYRGSFRGSGAELRTDAYGAVRTGAGLLISSYKIAHSAAAREAAGENEAGIAMLKQAMQLAESFNSAAKTHETVGLASYLGATKAATSAIDDKAAPLKALWTVSAAMLSKNSVDEARADAAARSIDAGAERMPLASAPIIGIAAKAGLGVVAGQDVQLSTGEVVTVVSGADSQFNAGGQMRVHSGQAIGVLAGAVKAGEGNVGLQLIAGKGAIDYQAQADELKVQARDEVNVISANAHIDWAAAKSISLSTAGGANITIDGGNITVQCPGKITVRAGMKKFNSPDHMNYPTPRLPKSEIEKRPLQFSLRLADTPGPHGHALASTPWIISRGEEPDGMDFIEEKNTVLKGRTDQDGKIQLSASDEEKLAEAYCANPGRTWLVYPGHTVLLQVTTESPDWDEKEKLLQAMNAADLSPDLHTSLFDDGASAQAKYGQEVFGVSSTKEIFTKVKS